MAHLLFHNVAEYAWPEGGYWEAFQVELAHAPSPPLVDPVVFTHWQVFRPQVFVPWSAPGIGQTFTLRATSQRLDAMGAVVERGQPGPWSDYAELHPVPEPATALLLAVGVVALGLLQQFRRGVAIWAR